MSNKRLTIYQAVHQHCIECAGGVRQVKPCEDKDCRFYPFRFGTNSYRKKTVKKRDDKTGKFIKSKKDIFIDGKYKLVRIDEKIT